MTKLLQYFRKLLIISLVSLAAACGSDGDNGGKKTKADGAVSDASRNDAAKVSDGATQAVDDAATASSAEVTIAKGKLQGKYSIAKDVRAFLGIPYGTANRFAAPEPVANWSGTRTATDYGSICPQLSSLTNQYDQLSNEDCLFLNVWTPEPAPATPLPVMVWLFGGAFQFGSGGSATTKYYDGEQLVKTGKVVVVTINYRVGPLGFFTHPALTADAATSGAPANFGILDQRLALQWVQDNIAAFGGDKTKVTVFGQSAGGNSVCIHLLSEGSRGLFSRAIVQSGLCMKHALTLAESEARGKRFAAGLGCTDDSQVLSCLRNLGADKITTGPADKSKGPGGVFFQDPSQDYFFQPVIDQRVLNEQLEPAFAAGRIVNKVPVLHGATTSEGIIFIDATLGATPVTSATEYQTALNNRFGARTADVIAKYPNFATDLSKINADAFFRCPAIRMAKYLSDAGIKNYLYRFNLYLMSAIPALKDQAFHSVEIPYIFGTSTFALGLVPADSTDASQTIMGYWTRFAAAGDPNGGSAPTWPSYDPTSHSFMNFETPIALGTTGWDDGCDFWENIPITAP